MYAVGGVDEAESVQLQDATATTVRAHRSGAGGGGAESDQQQTAYEECELSRAVAHTRRQYPAAQRRSAVFEIRFANRE